MSTYMYAHVIYTDHYYIEIWYISDLFGVILVITYTSNINSYTHTHTMYNVFLGSGHTFKKRVVHMDFPLGHST